MREQRTERGHSERLGLPAREEGGAVHRRQHASPAADLAHILCAAPVGALALHSHAPDQPALRGLHTAMQPGQDPAAACGTPLGA